MGPVYHGLHFAPFSVSWKVVLKTFLGHYVLFLLEVSLLRTGPVPSLSLSSSHHQCSADHSGGI